MARLPRVQLIDRGVIELLRSSGVRDHLESLAGRVEAAAVAGAPVVTGDYRGSIHSGSTTHPRRVVGRVWADSDHAMLVESRTGNLARALDAARGG